MIEKFNRKIATQPTYKQMIKSYLICMSIVLICSAYNVFVGLFAMVLLIGIMVSVVLEDEKDN